MYIRIILKKETILNIIFLFDFFFVQILDEKDCAPEFYTPLSGGITAGDKPSKTVFTMNVNGNSRIFYFNFTIL